MKVNLNTPEGQVLRTTCGKEYNSVFKAIKLMRDEKQNFHVVYKTFTDEFIYSSCNPFVETYVADTYKLISEAEAKVIFLQRLSQDNALELFDSIKFPQKSLHS
jgi:hypothetical protein